jgi:hypothetical protein
MMPSNAVPTPPLPAALKPLWPALRRALTNARAQLPEETRVTLDRLAAEGGLLGFASDGEFIEILLVNSRTHQALGLAQVPIAALVAYDAEAN